MNEDLQFSLGNHTQLDGAQNEPNQTTLNTHAPSRSISPHTAINQKSVASGAGRQAYAMNVIEPGSPTNPLQNRRLTNNDPGTSKFQPDGLHNSDYNRSQKSDTAGELDSLADEQPRAMVAPSLLAPEAPTSKAGKSTKKR